MCTSCNGAKGSCFDIQGERVDYEKYKNHALKDLQNIGNELDEIEKPLLINPEEETQAFFDEHLIFRKNGKILSTNQRLRYTIRICNLNRAGLVKLRLEIMNDLQHKIKESKHQYQLKQIDLRTYARDVAKLKQEHQNKLETNIRSSALYKFIAIHFSTFL